MSTQIAARFRIKTLCANLIKKKNDFSIRSEAIPAAMELIKGRGWWGNNVAVARGRASCKGLT